MSFANNASNLTGKSTTNAFNVIANSLIVNKDTLLKGDLTVLGNTTFGDLTLENANVNNLTVNNFTATNPVPITSGGTGLATIGAANQVLQVNPGGTALIYGTPGLSNPAVITGTGFTGSPTLTLGLEADTGSLGRGFIRTGPAAVNGLVLGTSSASVLRLWSNFSTDSNLEISNTNANFTYNSSGTTGIFQVLNGGGSISFTNIGLGTISMATGIGAISLSTGAGSTSITTGAGSINLTTGLGNISLVTAGAGGIEIITATAGAINIGTSVGLVNLFGSGLTLGAPVIYIGTGSAVPIPSILTFACGAVTGITGAWTITTLGFQLNALSISLNSTGTILLNGTGTTINGSANILGNVFGNASNLASTTVVNPAVFVYSGGGNNWGIDLGYKASSGRYRTRIFAPTGGDIALSIGSGSNQSDFVDKLIVHGTSGNVEVINGNIITNQNIIGGIEIINNGNLTLTAASPGYILIRGGSGSIITLPDATTLIVGYTYTINNNSNNAATVNRHTSGLVGVVPSLSAATITCIGTSSANGTWDIHITGPSAGTDWATPGQIGSAVPNTGIFTTLSATQNIFANAFNTASTTVVNPAVFVYSGGGNNWGIDLGYKAASTRFRTRIFAPTGGDITLSIGSGSNQSDFTDQLTVNGTNGNIEISQNLSTVGYINANSSSQASTSSLNPSITVFRDSGQNYGMDLGYNATSARYRTRIFAPVTNGDIALSIGTGSTQADYTDRLIVRGDTGNVDIISPTTTVTGTRTEINGTSTSLGTTVFQVNNTATATNSNIASFLQPTLGDIGVLTEDLNLTFGKSNTTNNSAQLQFGYTLASPTYNNPFTTWGFYGLSGTYIQLRQNPSATQNKVLITGNTRIDGDLKISGAVAVKNSSSFYFNTAAFSIIATVWTDAKNILVARSSGVNTLTTVSTGFRNDTGYTLQVSVSFTCQQVTGGFVSLRIAYDLDSQPIAQQDVESTNPQYINVSANFNLEAGSRIRCLIRDPLFNSSFQGVLITINTTPIF